MQPCPGGWVAIGRVYVCARSFSAGIKCRHCIARGGGGHSGSEGGRILVTYFAEEGVFFEDLRMSAIL